MNCSQMRAHLPALLYGDVSAEEKTHLEKHVAECQPCRAEFLALQGVRRLLGTAAPSSAHVDLLRLYRLSAGQTARRLRRWQWAAALAAGAAAVVAMAAFGLRFELRLQSHQFVLRWGAVPPADV